MKKWLRVLTLVFIIFSGCNPTVQYTPTFTLEPSLTPTEKPSATAIPSTTATSTATRTLRLSSTTTETLPPEPTLTPMATRILASDTSPLLWEGNGTVLSLLWHPNGEFLLAGVENNGIISFTLPDGEMVGNTGNKSSIQAMSMSPDEQYAAVVLADDGSLRLIDLETGMLELTIWPAHEQLPNAVVFSPDSKKVISCAMDNLVKVWDVETGELIDTIFDESICSDLAVTPDGKKLVVAFPYAEMVHVFDIATWKELSSFSTDFVDGEDQYLGHFEDIDISPDGRSLVSANGLGTREAVVWDLASGTHTLILGNHPSWVYAAEYSPSGKLIATGGLGMYVYLWDAATGEPLFELETGITLIQALAFSPDGTMLAAGGSSDLFVWDLTALSFPPSRLP